MGRSPIKRAAKYEERRYIREVRSLDSISRSCGKVKMASEAGVKFQKPTIKKISPTYIRSISLVILLACTQGSLWNMYFSQKKWKENKTTIVRSIFTWSWTWSWDWNHKKPARRELTMTWVILKLLKDSCFRSFRPLSSSTVNWSHQLVHHFSVLLFGAFSLNCVMISSISSCTKFFSFELYAKTSEALISSLSCTVSSGDMPTFYKKAKIYIKYSTASHFCILHKKSVIT